MKEVDSSISDAARSVWIKLPLPMICRSCPGADLSAATAAMTSPCSSVELFQCSSFSVREATCFLAALSVCAIGLPAGCRKQTSNLWLKR